MQDINTHYLVGYFEAGGCAGISKVLRRGRPVPFYNIYARVSSADPEPCASFMQAFGGSVLLDNKSKGLPVHRWHVQSIICEQFLNYILPYLRLQRKIDIVRNTLALRTMVTDYIKINRGHVPTPPISAKGIKEREALYQEVWKLNNRK